MKREQSAFVEFSRWYAIHTKPKQESRAESNLNTLGIETFTPKIGKRRYNQYTGKVVHVAHPLFPRYIFARFKAAELLHKVCFTRGVDEVLRFGDKPCPVDDEVILLIKSRQSKDGFVRIGEDLNPGDKVSISNQYLKGLVGIFERNVKGSDRVTVLLTTVSYQIRVQVEKDSLRKME